MPDHLWLAKFVAAFDASDRSRNEPTDLKAL